MKSVANICAFALFLGAAALPARDASPSVYLSGAGTVREIFDRGPKSPAPNVYNLMYCYNNRCPKWRCQDDSAVIHGYCCGCPNSLADNVPVLCADDLKCPLRMKNLCNDYHFMITCCCSGY